MSWAGRHPRLATALLVGAAAVLPYLGSLHDPPVLDDGWTALQNPLVWSLRNAGRIFRELYGWAGEPSVRGPYRPLTTLSFALNYAVHGPRLPGFHAVNLCLHALASLLVAGVARRLIAGAAPSAPGRAEGGARVAGLVFAVHPAHVEAVVTLYGRTEPLSAVFALAALLLALRSRGRPAPALAAAALLACGILAKEMAVMVPALYLLAAVCLPAAAGLPARPGLSLPAARRALGRALGVGAALSLAFVPYLVGHGPGLAVQPEARWFPAGTPPLHVFLTMSRVLGEYLRILAFPTFLGGDFAYAARLPTLASPTFAFWVATAAWLFTLAAGVVLARRAPAVGVGVLWIFVALLPVLQLVPVGVLLAERLLYLPSAGFSLAVAAGWALLPAAGPAPGARARVARAGLAAAGALLVLLGARTVVRARDWTSSVAFWESELAKAPGQVVVNNNLAVAYTGQGEPQKAIPRLEVAIADHPTYWRAWVNLGIARGELGDRAAALRAFAEATRLAPEASDPQRFLARMLRRQGDLAGAVAALERARRNAPEQAVLARELGEALLQAGRPAQARAALADALRLDPADAAARRLLEGLPPPRSASPAADRSPAPPPRGAPPPTRLE